MVGCPMSGAVPVPDNAVVTEHEPTSLYDVFRISAEARPDAVAIVFAGRSLSYRELDALIRRTACALGELGVTRGDRVLVYSPNTPEYLALYLACAYTGAVFTPANAGFRAREMAYVCQNAEAAVAVVHHEGLEDFERYTKDAAGRPARTVVLGAPDGAELVPGVLRLETLGRGAPDAGPHPVGLDDPVLICYTSGTTATPKPVLHSHRSEIYNATTYAHVWHFTGEDRAVVCLPLAWLYGLSTSSMALLAGGSSIVLLPRFHPVDVLAAIEAHRATVMFGTMAMYTKMLDVLHRRPHDLSTLRLSVNGGEACTDGAVAAFEEHTGVKLLQAYALSEARPLLAVDPLDTAAPTNVSGRPVPGAEIRLVDAEGTPVPRGAEGEAEVRCAGQMDGYYREPQMTAEKMTDDGWVRTGDLLVEDEAGYYRVIGRRSDLIIRSGANIAPAEVESAILTHPSVAEARVVGISDATSGEAVVALVVPRNRAHFDVEELRRFLGDALASYKVPQHVLTIDEMPTNVSGKADRNALRIQAEALLARR